MIKKQSLEELKEIINENPNKNCYVFSSGMMFAVLNDDVSCITGETQISGKETIYDKTYTIYIGGSIKKT